MFKVNDPRIIKWDLFVIILALYNSFSIPFEVAFEPPVMETTGFTVLNNIIDFCFLLDLIINFRTTYYDPVSGDEIFNKKLIAKNYLKGRFMIDFLSTIPLDNLITVSIKG